MFWTAFLMSSMLSTSQHPAELQEPASASEGSAATQALLITLKESKSLDPALAAILPMSVVAAFELSEGYQVVTDEETADWDLKLSVSGKGPWKLHASALPVGDNEGKRLSREVSFAGREEVPRAAGALVAGLHEAWLGAGETLAVPPFADVLSSSTAAVEAYLAAQDSLRKGRIDEARSSLEVALQSDTGFALALAERWYFALTEGDRIEEDRREAAGGSPQDLIVAGLASLARGEGKTALEIAEGLRDAHPDLLWGRVIRGLSLSGMGRSDESLGDWIAVTSLRPRDPRAQMWLGRALFATGDMDGAAGAFRAARQVWPALLLAYTLEAEAQVRIRETAAARSILNEMRSYMQSHGIAAASNELHAGLMLGSVDLLEGHFNRALSMFEQEAEAMAEAGVFNQAARMLHRTIMEMRRDLAVSTDPVARARQIEDAREALEAYRSLLPAGEREDHPYEILRYEGLLSLKLGNTIEAWRYIEELKSHAGHPGYSEYYEAYLTAATLVIEGDIEGCLEHFKRAAEASGRVADLMDVAWRQQQLELFPETRITLEEMERRLASYDASEEEHSDLILPEPHLAALVPLYHHFRAQFAYFRGEVGESRRHFNYMLKYLQEPDERLMPMVRDAVQRGARPE